MTIVSRNSLIEQSQWHFMALDNFMLLRGFLEHSRTAETSAQKCSKPDNFNLKSSKIFWGGAQPLPRPWPKNLFGVPTDELLRAKDDLLSEGGQSLSSFTEQVVRQSLQPLTMTVSAQYL